MTFLWVIQLKWCKEQPGHWSTSSTCNRTEGFHFTPLQPLWVCGHTYTYTPLVTTHFQKHRCTPRDRSTHLFTCKGQIMPRKWGVRLMDGSYTVSWRRLSKPTRSEAKCKALENFLSFSDLFIPFELQMSEQRTAATTCSHSKANVRFSRFLRSKLRSSS